MSLAVAAPACGNQTFVGILPRHFECIQPLHITILAVVHFQLRPVRRSAKLTGIAIPNQNALSFPFPFGPRQKLAVRTMFPIQKCHTSIDSLYSTEQMYFNIPASFPDLYVFSRKRFSYYFDPDRARTETEGIRQCTGRQAVHAGRAIAARSPAARTIAKSRPARRLSHSGTARSGQVSGSGTNEREVV